MPRIPNSDPYKNVSHIYNHLMRKVRYDYWADYIYSITNHLIVSKPKVLELGAGNCRLAEPLSAYYSKYIATDLSFSMLEQAKTSSLKKVCCDMKFVPFNCKFDLILSAFDSINYLITKKDLSTLLNEIKRVIADKGVFTFDVSLEANSYKHIKTPTRIGSYKGIKYKQETNFDPSKRIHKNIFNIIYPNGKVFNEIHVQKVFSFETYFQLIENAGLQVRECYEAFTYKDGTANSPRVQFILTNK